MGSAARNEFVSEQAELFRRQQSDVTLSLGTGSMSSSVKDYSPDHESGPDEYNYAYAVKPSEKNMRSVVQYVQNYISDIPFIKGARSHSTALPSSAEDNLTDFEDCLVLPEPVYETAGFLKDVTEASGVVVYMIDKEDEIIYLDPRRLQHKPKPDIIFRWHIHDNIIASHAVLTKKFAWSDNIKEDSRFPNGVGWTDHISSALKYVLSAPIVTPDGEVVAVIELYKLLNLINFIWDDVQMLVSTCAWIGIGIYQNQLRSGLLRQQQLHTRLLKYISRYFSEPTMTQSDVFREIMAYAKKTLNAEKSFVYVLNQIQNETLVDLFCEGVEETSKMFRGRRIKLNKLPRIVKHVIDTKQSVNIYNIFESDFQDEERVRRGPNETSRSILCAPIKDNDTVTGILLLTNKRDNDFFTMMDDANFQTFATYSSLALHHNRIKKELLRTQHTYNVNMEVLNHHWAPCHHDLERLKASKLVAPPDFFSFKWYPLNEHFAKIDEYALVIYKTLLGDSFMRRNNMPKFVSIIKKSYRTSTLYHNFEHGYTVFHGSANILIRNKQYFTGIELVGMLIGSIGHDVDHRAQTNSFIYLIKHPMALLYESAILENHHFYVTNMIIKECELFSYLNPELYKQVINEVETIILHTDLALHFRGRARLAGILAERQFRWPNPDHRFLMKGIIMTACDLTGQSKTFEVAERLLIQLYQEFYAQGDEEKKLGLNVLAMMDREKLAQIPEDQVRFLSFIVVPCNELLYNLFPNTKEIIDNTRALMETWKDIVDKKEGCTWTPDKVLLTKLPPLKIDIDV